MVTIMSEEKPTQFDIIKGLNASFKEEIKSPTDLIMEKAKESGVLPGRQRPKMVGDKLNLDAALPTIPPLEIDGYKLQRTNIPHMDALTVVMYILATEFADNPRIKAVLDQINFNFHDLEGKVIYPPQKTKQKKKKRD